MMKKSVIAMLVLGLVVFGTGATLLAWGGPEGGYGYGCPGGGPGGGPAGGQGWHHGKGGQGRDLSAFPAEIRTKMESLRETNRELRDVLSAEKPNQAQARILFEKSQSLRQEIARWRFDQRLAGNVPGKSDKPDKQFGQGQAGKGMRGQGGPGFQQGPAGRDWSSLPTEIRAKMENLRETNQELRTVMTAEKPDAAKARALYEKSEKLRQEIGRWHFEQRLEAKTTTSGK